ncbi:poly(A) polymerase [Planobispora rosea]|uniref:poly(A) polymerase n=1 Tax=Planobispora rosea TaxID=35762 RepID=UPI001C4012DB|nr:poly(A) polymerase [Planobispora rosea]
MSMRTSEEIYHRIRWDPRFDPARFILGINVRGAAPKRVPLPVFVPGGDIPWHRILFVEADGEVVWDRATGLDRIDATQAGRVREPRRLRAPFFTASTPFAWDPVAGWRPAQAVPAGRAPAAGARLRVLTWNTLWDRYDSDRISTARRRPLLLEALERADADVIALQEVETGLLEALLRARWVRSGYTLGTDPAGRDVDDSGLLLLSRLPVREAGHHVLGPHKAVTAVTVESAAGPVVVAATHLTSDHTDDGPARREAELTRLAEVLASVDGEVILLGDLNDGGSGPARVLGLRDAWTEVHGPGDRTPTFDPRANPLAALSSLSGRASRLDRVLLRGTGLRAGTAALLGDSPATPDGLFVSDHYGLTVDLAADLAADLAGDGHGSSGVLDARPTARTAVVWIPPEGLWPVIQEIRREHDPGVRRWPPHVTVMFGFVPESRFEEAVPLLAAAAAETAPFTARLDGVQAFPHRDGFTVWLDPAAAGPEPWAGLRGALERRFPGCRGRSGGYTPHLTLGRTRDPERLTADAGVRLGAMSARVGELVLLSRRGEEPMRPRAAVALGTGEVRWLDQETGGAEGEARADGETGGVDGAARADEVRAQEVVGRLRHALGEGVVHVTGSRRLGCAPPGADLDLVAVLPGAPDPAAVGARVRAALPEVTMMRRVTGARVPGLRLRLAGREPGAAPGGVPGTGLDVDLVVVAAGEIAPAEAVPRRAELGEAAAIALSAVSDAGAVLAAAGASRTAFTGLARRVKAWARARGLDSAPFGGLPGLAWTVLAARTVREAGDLPPDELLRRFFGTWAAWDWSRPAGLWPDDVLRDSPSRDALSPDADGGSGAAVRILTPTAPVRLCSEQVGAGWRDLLTQELYACWEALDAAAGSGRDPWPALVSPPPMHRRHAAWAVVTVRAGRDEEFDVTLGRVRGRVRALLTSLERAGVPDAHAWPRPFEIGPDLARFAIGLGRTPPDAAGLAAVAAPWAAGLRGAGVAWAEGGEVPTLR